MVFLAALPLLPCCRDCFFFVSVFNGCFCFVCLFCLCFPQGVKLEVSYPCHMHLLFLFDVQKTCVCVCVLLTS